MLTQISASAGSGKTYTLTRLFIGLLEKAVPQPELTGCALHGRNHGYSLAEILAATFTNKAAAEMKSRVVSSLKEEALRRKKNGEETSLAEAWVERILRHYNSLNIRTIDSLLAALVRLSALELRLPPDFEPSFDPADYFTPYYDALMEDLAAAAHAEPDLSPLPADEWSAPFYAGEEAAPSPPRETISRALPGETPPSPFLTTDGAALRARLDEACRSLLFLGEVKGFTPKRRLHDMLLELTERLLLDRPTPIMDTRAIHARLRVLHDEMAGACRDLLEQIAKAGLNAKVHYLRFLGNCAALPLYRPLPDSAFRHKTALDECLNKSSQGAAPAGVEVAFARAGAALSAHAAALPLFRHALQLAPLVMLAHEIHCRMQADSAGTPLLPALRLPGLAGKVLNGENGVSDALCRLGSRLSQLLLDEFQDTSREQWAAILPLAVESLSTGGGLTYVGDVKQAIYGWRGGDARLFDAVPDEPELLAIAPEPRRLQLEYNWRSHPAVVAHNNAFFSLLADPAVARAVMEAMLPAHTPEAYRASAAAGAETFFSHVRQAIPQEKRWEDDPKSPFARVRLYLAEDSNIDAVNALVRERLRRLLFEELLPHWEYGDIAVLVHIGDEASLAAEWLTDWGLPVVTENSFLLASHPLVGRLIALLTFLDYPLDDLAFWEFASGPECLGREGVWTGRPSDWLAGAFSFQDAERPPLYQVFRKSFPELWDRCLAPFASEAGLMSAYDALCEAVKRFTLLERMPEQAPFLRRLLEIAHLAESRGHSSLAAFLAFWRDCRENEKLPLPETMNAVRIMTIHKAKGLEFPVVILPFQHKGKRRTPELAEVSCQGLSLLTRAGREVPDIHYPACVTDDLERLNLLYVAWTRPIYALHAFITRPRSASTPLTRALETLLAAYRADGTEDHCQWEVLKHGADSADQPEETAPAKVPSPAEAGRPSPPAATCRDSLPPLETAALPGGPPPQARQETPAPPLPWRPMNWLPRLKIYRSPLPDPEFTPRQRGILAHLCLEQLLPPRAGEEAERTRDVERAVRQGIRLFPLPLADPEGIAREMIAGLTWFAALPEAAFWLEHGLREQEIMDENGRMHRVDLLVAPPADSPAGGPASEAGAGEPSALYALDYKTGQEQEEHAKQVRRYMRLTAEATGRPVHGILVYLDRRRLVRLDPENTA